MSSLHPLLARLRGSSDVVLAVLALGATSLLVAPLPPWALNLCIAANLALSATVLVVALFARDALRFASFPTLLLFSTLFRVAIEVSSTRLILARGEAGRVIQAFGQVVVAGNYAVGAVMFAILTLVQLLVVAKGAERVAEVTARFTLDALPGKQMSIDADLRTGTIDQGEARRRRRSLEREGQLYGAMDGALKFVKGDAVAGVVIVLANVGAGLALGLWRGMPLEAAARRYALLAIGDGLAAQVPALLVCVSAGVAVTRVAAEEEGSSLSADLGRQLFGDPRAMGVVAALCGAMALLPGLPAVPFLALCAGASGLAYLRRRAPGVHRGEAGEVPLRATSDAAPELAALSPLVLELAPDLAELARAGGGHFSGRQLAELQAGMASQLGVPLPEIALRPAPLPPGGWRLLLDGAPAAVGRAPSREALALIPPSELQAVGIPAAGAPEPLSGLTASRISLEDAHRAEALAPVRYPLERVGAGVASGLRAHAHLLVGVQEVQRLLDALEPSCPALVREVVRQIPVPTLAEVLRQLLEEGVAVRPLRAILEASLEAWGSTRGPASLADACRRALRRQIAHELAGSGTIDALLVDPAVEAALRDSQAEGAPPLDPREARSLLDQLERALAEREPHRLPILLTSATVRRPLRRLIAPRFPGLKVLSYEEIPPALPVCPVGTLARAA